MLHFAILANKVTCHNWDVDLFTSLFFLRKDEKHPSRSEAVRSQTMEPPLANESNKARTVPLNAEARQALNDYLQVRPASEEQSLFIGQRGEPLFCSCAL